MFPRDRFNLFKAMAISNGISGEFLSPMSLHRDN